MHQLGSAVRPVSTRRPSSAMVEHDPGELLAGAMASARSERLLPRPEHEELYDTLYQRHRALDAALRPLFS